jgi:BMFP domain-containing protein YqiC
MAPKVDVDSLRDYFDQKVAEVTRTEALIDALAQESEEYIELETKIKEVSNANLNEDDIENFEALTLQLQFKRDKIHQLAQRLSKKKICSEKGNGDETNQNDAFLFDAEFSRLCNGKSPVALYTR